MDKSRLILNAGMKLEKNNMSKLQDLFTHALGLTTSQEVFDVPITQTP